MRPSDSLLRRGIPKTDIRKELENWSDGLSRWERLWTAVVVGGLAIEVFVRLDRFFPHGIFDLIWPHSSSLGDIGDAMVFIGVFGELVVASRSGRVETALRDENAKVIGEANERAAKAEQAAAEANLARVKLEAELRKRTVSRLLNKDEADSFVNSLRQFKGQHFAIYWNSLALKTSPSRVAEQLALATQLRELLIKTGWEEQLTELPTHLETPDGVTLYFSSIVREESETLLLPTVASAIATEFMRLKISSQVTLNVRIPPQVLVVAVGILP